MKYFIDTEFLEGKQDKRFLGMKYGETKPTIDLISIGIICEDGREYYAISKDFNLKEAWKRYDWKEHKATHKEDEGKILHQKVYWIRENVLKPIYKELHDKENLHARQALHRANVYIKETDFNFTYRNLKRLINKYGKTNKQIAEEIKQFVGTKETIENWEEIKDKMNTQFYGYYSDYDWVVFCWLFGKMIDLPDGFPMYCIDLKQMLDEKANTLTSFELSKLAHSDIVTHNVYSTYDTGVLKCSKTDLLKNALNYPKQTNEHNALADAKWNYELYKFLQQL